jgi:CRISPR system Cascade subunit CasB
MIMLGREDARRAGRHIERWWRALVDPERGDRATLAELRRCTEPGEVAFVPSFYRLLRKLGEKLPQRDLQSLIEPAAVAAMVLAQVREARAGHPARQLGPEDPRRADSPRTMSELRFRSLLQARTAEEVARTLSRAVRMLGGTADPAVLASSVFAWGDRTRREWAFEYYGAAWSLRAPAAALRPVPPASPDLHDSRG